MRAGKGLDMLLDLICELKRALELCEREPSKENCKNRDKVFKKLSKLNMDPATAKILASKI